MRKKILAWMMAAVLAAVPAVSASSQDLIIEYEETAIPEAEGELAELDGIVIESITEEVPSEEAPSEETSAEEIQTEESPEQVSEAEEFLILVEEAEAPAEVTEEAMETAIPDELVEGRLTENGYASSAVMPQYRSFARSVYAGTYGAQLDGLAAELYMEMKSAYVTARGSGQISYSIGESYTFEVPDLQIVESNGQKKAVWDPAANEAYQAVAAEIRYGMQAAYDAFVYDYPEVYWLAAPDYAWGISFTGSESGGYKGKISKIQINPNECYEGAAAEIAAFDAAVDAVSSELASELPENADTRDIVAVIHDYLCNTVSYESNVYAHTAAGVFLKDRAVVCEGYAKAFKILCSEYGIVSALIPGGALKANGTIEAHMWNYVQMDDGMWYLVDVTWDDQGSRISNTYFLAGSMSNGFVDIISAERYVYSKFSGGAAETQSFVMPMLSQEPYGMHSWEAEVTTDREATCRQKGIISIHCSVCDAVREGSQKTIPLTAHVWESEFTVDQEPTCTAKGLQSIHCSVCDVIKGGSQEQIGRLSHLYGKYKVTKAATVLEQGVKTRTCSVCGKKQKQSIAKLERTMTVNVTKLKLQVGQSTTAVKVTGLGKGDSVASWKSSNISVATVSKKGRITAKKAGKAVITITLKSKLSKKITVTVQKKAVKTTKITGLKSSVTIKKGKTLKLAPVLKPITSTQKITYTSRNKKIATVSSGGKITAKKKGTTYIIVKSGSISKKVKVTVK